MNAPTWQSSCKSTTNHPQNYCQIIDIEVSFSQKYWNVDQHCAAGGVYTRAQLPLHMQMEQPFLFCR